MNKLTFNPAIQQFIEIEPETALKRYLELEPSDESYARFTLILIDYKRGKYND
jgi:hypothetical protein